jgi:hypothetical protein
LPTTNNIIVTQNGLSDPYANVNRILYDFRNLLVFAFVAALYRPEKKFQFFKIS